MSFLKGFFISLILCLQASAGEMHDGLQILRDTENKIVLKTDCSLLPKATQNLKSLGPLLQHKNQCTVDLSMALPEKMSRLHDHSLPHSGPNCWNASLYLTGTVETLRFVTQKEMYYLTHSPICKELTLIEPLAMGDIIALHYFGNGPDEFHGFNYINDLLAFTKLGYDQQFGYEVVSTNYVFSVFALGFDIAKPFCRRTYGVPLETDCNVFAQYYRCQDRNAFLKNSVFRSKNTFLLMDQKIRRIEETISQATAGKNIWNSIKSLELQKQIQILQSFVQDSLQKVDSQNAIEVFFWQSTSEKLNSLFIQIKFLDEKPS